MKRTFEEIVKAIEEKGYTFPDRYTESIEWQEAMEALFEYFYEMYDEKKKLFDIEEYDIDEVVEELMKGGE